MYEFFPLIAGVLLGALAYPLSNRVLRTVVLVVVSIVIGFVASTVSGELAASWAFLLFDAGQVLLTAFLTTFLLARWRQQRTI
ncbi:MAG: hypothetical protein R3C14_32390 [Caldilineaceae bacterium]